MTTQHLLSIGKIINERYRIDALLGQGGFGAVYRAWDLRLKAVCAVKENLVITPESLRQFEREAVLLAGLRHPNLPRVIDHFSTSRGGQYVVMDFVEGRSLEAICQQSDQRLSEAQVVDWIDQVCSALDYLHSQSPPILHRDIKPSNIIITHDQRAILVDFGIAKLQTGNVKTTIGAQGITPGFSPFEQYGQGATDMRSDVYALGATLYTLLTNHIPPESIARLGGASLPSVRSLAPQVSRNLERVTQKALNLKPEERFATIADFQSALTSGAGQLTRKPSTRPRTSIGQTSSSPFNFSTQQIGLGAIGLVVLLGWLGWMNFLPSVPVTPQPTLNPAVTPDRAVVLTIAQKGLGALLNGSKPLEVGSSLSNGSRVRVRETKTGCPTCSVTLLLVGEAQLILGPDTELTLNEIGLTNTLTLLRGTALISLAEAESARVQLESPSFKNFKMSLSQAKSILGVRVNGKFLEVDCFVGPCQVGAETVTTARHLRVDGQGNIVERGSVQTQYFAFSTLIPTPTTTPSGGGAGTATVATPRSTPTLSSIRTAVPATRAPDTTTAPPPTDPPAPTEKPQREPSDPQPTETGISQPIPTERPVVVDTSVPPTDPPTDEPEPTIPPPTNEPVATDPPTDVPEPPTDPAPTSYP